ncbi:low affinity immunoglobulin epsilon Fc receptor-like isoform X2 [Tachyglossus aculeatus]|uniref:low affinity immunoglobulin epsilon Fc receptor-like isoform X2 n=1 Tax=Tachyglossus aculeatus TaxID=9261 RepID=UPI0018F62576|nr:low affinity immunoglobulin epsilon Fc receptor-like isoform X2 [Tachyglossus aculeatus]
MDYQEDVTYADLKFPPKLEPRNGKKPAGPEFPPRNRSESHSNLGLERRGNDLIDALPAPAPSPLKNPALRTWIVPGIILSSLVVVVISLIIVCSRLNTSHTCLSEKFTRLLSNYTHLSNSYSHLSDNYTHLSDHCTHLLDNYTHLSGRYTHLSNSHKDLSEELSNLRDNHTHLIGNYTDLWDRNQWMENRLSKLVTWGQGLDHCKLQKSEPPYLSCLYCPAKWLLFRQNCYFFSENSEKWARSREQCQDLQSTLVTIIDHLEQVFLSVQAAGKTYWIGLTDEEHEGEWKYWAPLQPDNYRSNENCVSLGEKEGFDNWNDADCMKRYPYICKKAAERMQL